MDLRIGAGYWSTNIGNAFFHLGLKSLLSELYPSSDVQLDQHFPGHWHFWNRSFVENAKWTVSAVPPDVLFLMGPMLRAEFPSIWSKSARLLESRDVRVCLVGVGFMNYSDSLIESCRQVLEKHPPEGVATRDRSTYEALRDLPFPVYDGVCPGFFVDHAFSARYGAAEDYLVSVFDKNPEPSIEAEVGGRTSGDGLPLKLADTSLRVEETGPTLATRVMHRAYEFVSVGEGGHAGDTRGPREANEGIHLLRTWFSRKGPRRVGELELIRTTHRTNPAWLINLFARPNTVCCDIPEPYLRLYSRARCILSDRVHACVAGLSFGVPVRLFGKTGRAKLMQRMGVEIDSETGFMHVPEGRIEEERDRLGDWLTERIG